MRFSLESYLAADPRDDRVVEPAKQTRRKGVSRAYRGEAINGSHAARTPPVLPAAVMSRP